MTFNDSQCMSKCVDACINFHVRWYPQIIVHPSRFVKGAKQRNLKKCLKTLGSFVPPGCIRVRATVCCRQPLEEMLLKVGTDVLVFAPVKIDFELIKGKVSERNRNLKGSEVKSWILGRWEMETRWNGCAKRHDGCKCGCRWRLWELFQSVLWVWREIESNLMEFRKFWGIWRIFNGFGYWWHSRVSRNFETNFDLE